MYGKRTEKAMALRCPVAGRIARIHCYDWYCGVVLLKVMALSVDYIFGEDSQLLLKTSRNTVDDQQFNSDKFPCIYCIRNNVELSLTSSTKMLAPFCSLVGFNISGKVMFLTLERYMFASSEKKSLPGLKSREKYWENIAVSLSRVTKDLSYRTYVFPYWWKGKGSWSSRRHLLSKYGLGRWSACGRYFLRRKLFIIVETCPLFNISFPCSLVHWNGLKNIVPNYV